MVPTGYMPLILAVSGMNSHIVLSWITWATWYWPGEQIPPNQAQVLTLLRGAAGYWTLYQL